MTTKRYPALNLDSLATAILAYHEPTNDREGNAFLDTFENLGQGDPRHFAHLMLRDLKDQDGAPFYLFDPDELDHRRDEVGEWMNSEEMHNILETWVRNQLGDDYFD